MTVNNNRKSCASAQQEVLISTSVDRLLYKERSSKKTKLSPFLRIINQRSHDTQFLHLFRRFPGIYNVFSKEITNPAAQSFLPNWYPVFRVRLLESCKLTCGNGFPSEKGCGLDLLLVRQL